MNSRLNCGPKEVNNEHSDQMPSLMSFQSSEFVFVKEYQTKTGKDKSSYILNNGHHLHFKCNIKRSEDNF